MSKSKSSLYVMGLAAGLLMFSNGNMSIVKAEESEGTAYTSATDLSAGKTTLDDIRAMLKKESVESQSSNGSKQATPEDASKKDNNKKSDKKNTAIKYPQFKGKAIAKAKGAVNIREKGDINSEIIGMLVEGGVCKVEQKGKEWTKISSGSCTGYINNKYLLFGDEAGKWCEKNDVSKLAKVNTEDLNVRSTKDEQSDCVALAHKGEQYAIADKGGDWTALLLDNGVVGYVKSKYIEVNYDTPVAESMEERRAYLAALEEEAARAAAEAAEYAEETTEDDYVVADNTEETEDTWSEDDSESTDTIVAAAELEDDDTYSEDTTDETDYTEDDSSDYTDDTDYTEDTSDDTEETYTDTTDDTYTDDSDESANEVTDETTDEPTEETTETPTEDDIPETPSSSTGVTGTDIANYALQFVGRPYVWAGVDLWNGCDCSGFTLSVYRDMIGADLPHDAEYQEGCGSVFYDPTLLQPGDLVFYAGGGYRIGHVGIFIGNGQIVHAANPNAGIIVSDYNYNDPVSFCRILQ